MNYTLFAGWPTALEQVPFFAGYGVETGLLIDSLERFGLDTMGPERPLIITLPHYRARRVEAGR